jgi:hypothetical protein
MNKPGTEGKGGTTFNKLSGAADCGPSVKEAKHGNKEYENVDDTKEARSSPIRIFTRGGSI